MTGFVRMWAARLSFFGIPQEVWVTLDLRSLKTRWSKGLVEAVNESELDACLSLSLRGNDGNQDPPQFLSGSIDHVTLAWQNE
jgi:hypothetical protein